MRRTILLLAGVLLCVVALGSDSPKEYDDKTIQSRDGRLGDVGKLDEGVKAHLQVFPFWDDRLDI